MGEQRDSERHRVRFHLVYDDGSSFNAGVVRDVSEGGLFLETALPLEVGTIVTLTPLDDAESDQLFEVRAQVVRSVSYDSAEGQGREAPGMGLQFVDLTPEERTSVVRMIWSLEDRAATQKGTKDPYLGVVVPSGQSRPQ